MLKARGGHKVGKGTYWNFTNGERIDIENEGILPGDSRTSYYRLPASGILLLGPVIGLVYAVFLPFIGIAMLVKLVAQKVAGGAMSTAPKTASFGWRPSESYMAGKKVKDKKAEEKESDGETKDN